MVRRITGDTLFINALTEVGIFTVLVTATGHTGIAIVPFNTDRGLARTAAIGPQLTALTDLVNALGLLAITMDVIGTLSTEGPAHTDGIGPATPSMIGPITALTLLVDTLGRCGIITVIICATAHTAIAVLAGNTNGRCPTTAAIIG